MTCIVPCSSQNKHAMTDVTEQGSGTGSQTEPAAATPRSGSRLIWLVVVASLLFTLFAALGTWQVYRLQWKLALIERVEQRVHAAPVDAPQREHWSQVTAASDEYRHVRVSGVLLHQHAVKVMAVTELGSGFWLLTPLQTADGSIVLINRGFIPSLSYVEPQPPATEIVVSGLLRISEPGGGFLRENDAAGGRWYSRDVAAIAAAQHLSSVAPYFIDQDARPQSREASSVDRAAVPPIGGLTVISFNNNHLVYALTWYVLALMVIAACWWVLREERRHPN